MTIIQLQQIICIAENKTLSKAAQVLHISQPALSRSMQSLEQDLGIYLFDHYKNRIVLNDNGLMLVKRAKTLLEDFDSMIEDVQAFAKSNMSLSIASCTPAPLWDIVPLCHKVEPSLKITTSQMGKDELFDALKRQDVDMIITPDFIEDDDCYCVDYLEEDLYLSIPESHPFSQYKAVSFKDLAGQTMLLYSNIGFWYDLHMKTMPETKFLFQDNRQTFTEIVKASSLPSFTSNLSIKREGKVNDRVMIPFLDDEAHVTFYCVILKKNLIKYQTLMDSFEDYLDY